MKISIITPTFNRELFHSKIYHCVTNQHYANYEWLVLDDSTNPSIFFNRINHPKIKYYHISDRMSIGNKRNWLIERSTGDIIIHFDDDDYYSPEYIDTIVNKFINEDLDFINLRGWFLHDKRSDFFGYWNLNDKKEHHFKLTSGNETVIDSAEDGFENNELGWGFGFAYRRSVWEKIKFEDINWKEDAKFSLEAHKQFNCSYIIDEQGICLHVVHDNNTSVSFAQYKMPLFLLDTIFPKYRKIKNNMIAVDPIQKTELLIGAGSKHDKRLTADGTSTFTNLITLDYNETHNPDISWDLHNLPLPFPDNSFNEIHAYEVLEHVGGQGDYKIFFAQFSEFYRLLKPNGFFMATVPSVHSKWAYGDPSHTRIIQKEQLHFLSQKNYENEVGVTSMSDFRSIYRANFEIIYAKEDEHSFKFILKVIK